MRDFRTVKDVVRTTMIDIVNKYPQWKWSSKVLKNEIRVKWGYLTYMNEGENDYFTIKMDNEPNSDDFMLALNERGEFISGRIVGTEESYQDGTFQDCVAYLLRNIAHIADMKY